MELNNTSEPTANNTTLTPPDQPLTHTPEPKKPNVLPILGGVIVVLALALAGYFFYQNQQLSAQLNTQPTPQPSLFIINPTTEPSPEPEIDNDPAANAQTITVPSSWSSYSDEAAGITIQYPPTWQPKLNSNRGAASNYHAGSYLVDEKGEIVLDFYFYGYDGGSRREAFYNAVEFDGPPDLSKFTQSAANVTLNGKTYLKVVTTYTDEQDGRVFYLIPQGDRLYYFTYNAGLEKNSTTFSNLQKVIASNQLNANSTTFPDTTNYLNDCFEYANAGNKGSSWDSSLDSNQNMVVIQRFKYTLQNPTFDPAKIEVSSNLQSFNVQNWNISNYTIRHDTSQNGGLSDAIAITLPKSEVEKIRASTQSSIPSVSFYIKINQPLDTTQGKACAPWGSAQTYYVNYP